jgi:polyhydroxybutyrate depolymerase
MQGAEDFGYIVAFPNGYLNQWNDGSQGDHYEDDVTILLELIEVMAERYNIDPEQIYLVGFSNGGTMVFRAACEAPNVFAGIASIGGTMRMAQDCQSEAALPILIIHGTGDQVVPFMGGNGRYTVPETANFWTELNGCDTGNIPDYDPERFRSQVAAYYYQNCPQGNQVLMYVIQNYPHTWPGATAYIRNEMPDTRVNSVLIIWAFFQRAYGAKVEEAETEITETRY